MAKLGNGSVLDSDMNSVCTAFQRNFGIVVYDKRNIVPTAKLFYPDCFGNEFFLGKIFFTELNDCYAALQCVFNLLI